MTSAELISLLALISRKKPDAIQGHLSLTGLGISSSFGVSALKSRLEGTTGRKLPFINANTTVDQLIGLVEGSAGAAPAPGSVPQAPVARPRVVTQAAVLSASPVGYGIGIDLEEIDEFPEAADFRDDPFYRSHFAPQEIAVALLRPDPRASLCGMFCVKEAAKKSHPSLLGLGMDQLRVSHDPQGKPALSLINCGEELAGFSFQISISHTRHYATAVCMTSWSQD